MPSPTPTPPGTPTQVYVRFVGERHGTDTRSPAEYADAQYHGAAGEW